MSVRIHGPFIRSVHGWEHLSVFESLVADCARSVNASSHLLISRIRLNHGLRAHRLLFN